MQPRYLSTSKKLVFAEKEVSVVIPAFNEASCLKGNISFIERKIKRITRSYEIILTEDGSSDGTDLIAAELAVENPCILHLHSDVRRGKGGALKRAFNASKGKVVIFMDADLATSLDSLSGILERIEEGYDGVIGSRNIKGSNVKRPLSRTLFSFGFNFLVRLLFKDGIYDHQCGFKAFRRDVLESMGDIESNGFLFDTEFIIRAKLRGFSISEFPVIWAEPEQRKSKVQLPRDAVRMGTELLKLRAKLWRP